MSPKKKIKRKRVSASAKSRQNAQELTRIEDLLGEDFESLAEARRALKSDTKDVVPKAAREVIKLGNKRSYTIHELKDGDKRTITAWLNDRATAEEIQNVTLGRGEVWGAETTHEYLGTDGKTHRGIARTWQSYGNLDQLFKRLGEYITHGKFGTDKSRDSFINSIRVIRFGTAAKGRQNVDTIKQANRSAWYSEKQSEVRTRVKRKAALARKLQKGEAAQARAKLLEQEVKELKRRIKEK